MLLNELLVTSKLFHIDVSQHTPPTYTDMIYLTKDFYFAFE